MATRSIFDCDATDTQNELQREQITYDDDLFDFGCEIAADDGVVIPENVSVSVTISQNGSDKRQIGKRKAHFVSESKSAKNFKVATSNASKKLTTNNVSRKAVENQSKCDEYEFLQKIGKGTYGDVYKARYSTGEIIAIKRIVCQLDIPNMVCRTILMQTQKK